MHIVFNNEINGYDTPIDETNLFEKIVSMECRKVLLTFVLLNEWAIEYLARFKKAVNHSCYLRITAHVRQKSANVYTSAVHRPYVVEL